MSEAVTWKNDRLRKLDLRHRKIADFKSKAFMLWHKVYWRILWATGLARPYSKLMCVLNLYRKFPDGRCGYCGEFK